MTVLVAFVLATVLITALSIGIAVWLVVGLQARDERRSIQAESIAATRGIYEVTREAQADIVRALIERRNQDGRRL